MFLPARIFIRYDNIKKKSINKGLDFYKCVGKSTDNVRFEFRMVVKTRICKVSGVQCGSIDFLLST